MGRSSEREERRSKNKAENNVHGQEKPSQVQLHARGLLFKDKDGALKGEFPHKHLFLVSVT